MDRQHLGAKVGSGGLGPAETDRQARQCLAVGVIEIELGRRLVDQLFQLGAHDYVG